MTRINDWIKNLADAVKDGRFDLSDPSDKEWDGRTVCVATVTTASGHREHVIAFDGIDANDDCSLNYDPTAGTMLLERNYRPTLDLMKDGDVKALLSEKRREYGVTLGYTYRRNVTVYACSPEEAVARVRDMDKEDIFSDEHLRPVIPSDLEGGDPVGIIDLGAGSDCTTESCIALKEDGVPPVTFTRDQLDGLSDIFHSYKDWHRDCRDCILEAMELERILSVQTGGAYEPDTTYDIKC